MTSYNIITYQRTGGIDTVIRNIAVDQGDQLRLHTGEQSSAELKGHEWGIYRKEKIRKKENQHINIE